MADTNANMQLYYELKKKFPQLPDQIVRACIYQFAHDPQRCLDILTERSINYTFGSVNDRPSTKQDASSYHNSNDYMSLQHTPMLNLHNNNFFSSSGSPYAAAGSGRIPRLQNEDGSFQYQSYDSRYAPANARSSSVSGAPSRTTANAGYMPGVTPDSNQPQSAPVMPSTFDPFHVEYNTGQSKVSISTTSQMPSPYRAPSPRPSYPANFVEAVYDPQRGMFGNQINYQMQMTYNQALLTHQKAQKDRLEKEVQNERQRVERLKKEVDALEVELFLGRKRHASNHENSVFSVEENKRVREDIRRLRVECDCMSREVDFIVKGQIPLGETSEDFYDHINPGQKGRVGSPPNRTPKSPTSVPSTSGFHAQTHPPGHPEAEEEGIQWSCSACTFLNNPCLDKCEMCEMARIIIGYPMAEQVALPEWNARRGSSPSQAQALPVGRRPGQAFLDYAPVNDVMQPQSWHN